MAVPLIVLHDERIRTWTSGLLNGYALSTNDGQAGWTVVGIKNTGMVRIVLTVIILLLVLVTKIVSLCTSRSH